MTSKPISSIVLACVFLCGSAASWAAAEDTAEASVAMPPAEDARHISVEVASGRVFTGEVDPKTDDKRLWMCFAGDSIVVQRPIQWDSVVAVSAGELKLSAQEFRDLVAAVRRRIGAPVVKENAELVIIGDPAERQAEVSPQTPAGRVRSLAIEATVANWDSDVEVDGLLVYVYPLDAEGRVVELNGTLQVDLLGRENVALARGRSFGRLGRWSKRVRPGDFGLRGAVYRLPFQGVHPQFDTRVAAHGAVHARLAVSGQGVFEATASDVRVRPPSALRDDLQQGTEYRYFPEERTGRGRRPSR